jgi:hypothetical protein
MSEPFSMAITANGGRRWKPDEPLGDDEMGVVLVKDGFGPRSTKPRYWSWYLIGLGEPVEGRGYETRAEAKDDALLEITTRAMRAARAGGL